jgi:hypothetical protein
LKEGGSHTHRQENCGHVTAQIDLKVKYNQAEKPFTLSPCIAKLQHFKENSYDGNKTMEDSE